MADVASLLAEFQKGIEGKDTGLGATVKFDFEGAGCIYLDGKSNPNTVSDEDKDADCTLSMSLETLIKCNQHLCLHLRQYLGLIYHQGKCTQHPQNQI